MDTESGEGREDRQRVVFKVNGEDGIGGKSLSEKRIEWHVNNTVHKVTEDLGITILDQRTKKDY